MKAWLKGGLIGIALLVIIIIFSWVFLGVTPGYLNSYLAYPIMKLLNIISNCSGEECWGVIILFIFIAPIIEFFLLGTLIGLIISKIKSRNQDKK